MKMKKAKKKKNDDETEAADQLLKTFTNDFFPK